MPDHHDTDRTAQRLEQLEARLGELERDEAWRSLIGHLEVVTWRRRPDKSLALLAGPVESLTGVDPHRLLSGQAGWDDLIHPEDLPRTIESRGKALAAGRVCRVDYRIVGADGRERWVREHSRAAADEAGRPADLDALVFDIDDQKSAESAEARSEAHYRFLADSALVGVYLHQDDQFRYVNRRLAEMFGFDSPEELIGRTPWDLVHPEDREKLKARGQFRQTEEPASARYVFRGLRRDGEVVWIEIHATHVTHHGRPANMGHLIDVTDEHRAEVELERRRLVFDVLFRTTPLAVALVNDQGLITALNPAFERLFGYSAAQAKGRTIDDLIVPPDLQEEGREYTRKTLEEWEVCQVEGIRHRRDGGRVRVWMSSSPVIIAGRLRGAFVTYTDITDRHRAEEALRAGYEQLRALHRLSLVATRSLAVPEFIEAVLDEVVAITGVESPGLFLWDETEQRLILADHRGLSNEFFEQIKSVELGRGATGQAAQERQPLFIDDYQAWSLAREDAKKEGMASMVAIPLLAQDRLLGALIVPSRSRRPFSDADKRQYTSIGQIVSASLANILLYAEAKDSEQRFRDVAVFTGDWIWETNVDGICTYSSPVVKSVVGFEAEEIVGRHFADFFPAQTRDEDARRMARAYRDHQEVSGLISTVLHADGHEVIIERFGRPLLDEAGRVIGYRGVNRDVTEQRQAWRAVRASEEKYRHLVTEIEEGFFETDRRGSISFANPALCRLIEGDLDDILGLSQRDFVAPYDQGRVYEVFNQIYRTGRPERTLEHDIITRQGEIRRVEVSAALIRDEKGQKLGFRGVIRDMTQRRQTEMMLRASEEKYRSLIEKAPIGIRINRDGRCLYLNPRLFEMLGLEDPGQAIERPVLEFYDPRDRDLVREHEERLLRGEDVPPMFEARGLTLDGRTIILGHLLTQVVYEGRPAVLAFIEDITARMEARQERESLQIRLAHANKMESIGRLAGGIAHDFNNILEGILGYASLAQRKSDDADTVGRSLKIIERAALRAAELTQQLLGFARQGKYEVEPVDIGRLVQRVLTLISRTFDRAIDVTTAIEPDLKAVLGDPGQLENCLLNLCINARDAMTEGGRLRLEAKNVLLDEEYCRAHVPAQPGDHVCVSVIDTGVGIDPAHRERIFDPFFTTKEGGTGLGLAMAYGIIRNHDGHIDVTSEPQKGSSFRVFLPATSRPASDIGEPAVGNDVVAGGDETILVVDDEEVIRSFAEEVLAELGYRVLLAEDGREAVRVFRDHADEVDLVILDLVMPGMSGLEALKNILSLRPEAEVLLSSGFSGGQRVDEMLAAGAKGLLRKPYRMTDLAAKVRELLDQRKSRGGNDSPGLDNPVNST
ncbi:MAG: PAS domain S-box protein [Proteobacteria bacterium]|nr:PAS domain S-box protein [Pseudomonadota bacterium]MBU1741641.1 PAS domain S-box protein [Pseudomonadota bacterium]